MNSDKLETGLEVGIWVVFLIGGLIVVSGMEKTYVPKERCPVEDAP